MTPRGNPIPLAEARRRYSLDKRARVLTVRAARVSSWLAYAPGVREHIESARLRRAHSTPITVTGSTPNPRSLRTELEIARQEIKDRRAERDRLQGALRHQLDAFHTPASAARADELAAKNEGLTRQLQQATFENAAFRARVTSLEEDLAAARTSLRRMIRNENRN